METLSPLATCSHRTIRCTTNRPTEFVDVTARLAELVAASDIRVGFVNVQSLHTTTAIIVNEHEPLLLDDFAALLDRTAPRGAGYRHDDASVRTVNVTADERINGHAAAFQPIGKRRIGYGGESTSLAGLG